MSDALGSELADLLKDIVYIRGNPKYNKVYGSDPLLNPKPDLHWYANFIGKLILLCAPS